MLGLIANMKRTFIYEDEDMAKIYYSNHTTYSRVRYSGMLIKKGYRRTRKGSHKHGTNSKRYEL